MEQKAVVFKRGLDSLAFELATPPFTNEAARPSATADRPF